MITSAIDLGSASNQPFKLSTQQGVIDAAEAKRRWVASGASVAGVGALD